MERKLPVIQERKSLLNIMDSAVLNKIVSGRMPRFFMAVLIMVFQNQPSSEREMQGEYGTLITAVSCRDGLVIAGDKIKSDKNGEVVGSKDEKLEKVSAGTVIGCVGLGALKDEKGDVVFNPLPAMRTFIKQHGEPASSFAETKYAEKLQDYILEALNFFLTGKKLDLKFGPNGQLLILVAFHKIPSTQRIEIVQFLFGLGPNGQGYSQCGTFHPVVVTSLGRQEVITEISTGKKASFSTFRNDKFLNDCLHNKLDASSISQSDAVSVTAKLFKLTSENIRKLDSSSRIGSQIDVVSLGENGSAWLYRNIDANVILGELKKQRTSM